MSDDPIRPQTKHDPDCVPRTWLTDRITPEEAGEPQCKRVTGEFELKSPAVFPTVSGGELRVGPGMVNAAFWISPVEPRDPESDDLVVETWLADDQGRGWRCRSYVGAYLVFESNRVEPFQSWESAPSDWKHAMSESCLLRDLRVLLDGRDAYELRLSSGEPGMEEPYLIKNKHQSITLDLALVEGTGTAIVRVSQFYHQVIRRGIDWRTSMEPSVDIGFLPTYAHELSPSTLFPRPGYGHYVGRYDEFFNEENPEPVTFYPWEPSGTPQENVVATGLP